MLVVAATELELACLAGIQRPGATGAGIETLCCGVGPVEAALATARALALRRPNVVLQIGIAGAHRLEPGSLVLGTEAVYADLADTGRSFPRIDHVRPDEQLLAMASRALPDAHLTAIATSARVGGGEAYEVEAMEGFAVLRAASAAAVPALELRAISNRFADVRADWRIDEAFAALTAAIAILQGVLDA